MKKITLVLSIFALIFTACKKEDVEPEINPNPSQTEDKWVIELVDSIPGMKIGSFNMLSYDVDSGVHIAYVATEGTVMSLKYAYKPYNGTWIISDVVSPLKSDIIDLAVDKQNNIFIAYELKDDDKLYIAQKTIEGQFNNVLIDILGENFNHQARYPALYADGNGTIHISFERANFGMRYTSYTYQGTFTDVEIMDDNIGGSSSDIVIDNAGNKHILHFNNEDIYYSYCSSSDNNWLVNKIATSQISGQSYEGISLSIDQFDNLHGVYRYETTTIDNNIHYLFKTHGSDTWTEEGISNVGGSNRYDRAIACDTLGNPHVLYDENFGLKIVSKNSIWVNEEIMGNSDYRCDRNYDIEITNKNRAHISFYCRSTGVLRYATKILQ